MKYKNKKAKLFGVAIAAVALVILVMVLFERESRIKAKSNESIILATLSLLSSAEEESKSNTALLKSIDYQTREHSYNQQLAYLTQKYERALALHRQAEWLSRNFIPDIYQIYTVGMSPDKEFEFGLFSTIVGGSSQPEYEIFDEKYATPSAHAQAYQNKLVQYLLSVKPFIKSKRNQQRLGWLLALAEQDSDLFYEEVYGSQKVYLLLSKKALITSKLAAIEAEYLYNLMEEIEQADLEEVTWFPVVQPSSERYSSKMLSSPLSVKAGDTLRFNLRLKSALKFPETIEPKFTVSTGTIDSVRANSIAYATIPPDTGKGKPGQGTETRFSLKVPLFYGRDTTFLYILTR